MRDEKAILGERQPGLPAQGVRMPEAEKGGDRDEELKQTQEKGWGSD